MIDTGPFVSYLHRNDPRHDDVANFINSFRGQLATTGAVIGEVMYFLSEFPSGPVAFAKLLISSHVQVVELIQPARALAAAELMQKYSDTPMDFADATLVLLAEELGVIEILTLDRRGFSTYRTGKGRAFRLVLEG